MKCTSLAAVVCCGVVSVQCLRDARSSQGASALQVKVRQHLGSDPKPKRRAHSIFNFNPTEGLGGELNATMDGTCSEDSYAPSVLEQNFVANSVEWTNDQKALCDHLGDRSTWIQENMKGKVASGNQIFSKLCKKGQAPQLLEPLAGILRDPRFVCDKVNVNTLYSIDWLLFADRGQIQGPSSRKIFFDAGGTRFMDAMAFFTSQYEKRGITFDQIYVWEATYQGTENYWLGIEPETRAAWEPKLMFYDGIPCSADPNHEHNPPRKILAECRPEDFCAFKLDIDTPAVELPIAEQVATNPRAAEVLDEFFFEHHVHGLMQVHGWGSQVNGTFADSYAIFQKLRKSGVRAHSWI